MSVQEDSLLVLMEMVQGQIKNIHHQLENTLLRKCKVLNGAGESVGASGKWVNGERRTIRVSVTVTCISPQPNLRLFAIEELTGLESLAQSLKSSIEFLRGPREDKEEQI